MRSGVAGDDDAGARVAALEARVEALALENERLRRLLERKRGRAEGAFRLFLGKRLTRASQELKRDLQEWHEGTLSRPPYEAMVDFGEASVRRWVRVGMFGFFAAMIPTVAIIVQTTLLSRQNRMIGEQNELFGRQNLLIDHQSKLMKEQNERLEQQNKLVETQNQRLLEQNELLVEEMGANRLRWAETHKVSLLDLLYGGMARSCTSGTANRRRGGVPGQCHPKAAVREREQAVQLYIDLERDHPSLGPGTPVSLAFLNLEDAYLPGVDMAGVDLYGALFHNTKLPRADLHDTNFRNAILDEVDFRDAILTGTDFRGALLSSSRFEGASLEGARFLEADGDERIRFPTELDGVRWDGATCPDGVVVRGPDATCEGHFLSSATPSATP